MHAVAGWPGEEKRRAPTDHGWDDPVGKNGIDL